jgi:AcrR family transcriptional regulator
VPRRTTFTIKAAPAMAIDKAGTNSRRGVRRSAAERKVQIAAVTLSLIVRYGLEGATINRIAEEVGIQGPSLYRYFSSRHEMLLAAIDLLFEKVDRWIGASTDPNCLDRLKSLGETHAEYLAAEFEGFVVPMYEFIAAPRHLNFTQALKRGQLQATEKIMTIVEGGKQQGTIRKDVDSRLAAWEFMVCVWAEDLAALLQLEEFQTKAVVDKMLQGIFRDIATDSLASDSSKEEAVGVQA